MPTGDRPVSGQRLGVWRRPGVGLVVAGLLLAFFWDRIVYIIRPGEAGVRWRLLSGTDVNATYSEGTHVIVPWDRLYIYGLRLQTSGHTLQALSADGVTIQAEVVIRYRVTAHNLPQLHRHVGPDYLNRIVVPEVSTAVRDVIGRYPAAQLLPPQTAGVQQQIVERASAKAEDSFVVIDEVLLRLDEGTVERGH